MQNNSNNPYDDIFNNLAKIVEEIVKNMPEHQHARIVGYTIITRHPAGGDPEIFRSGPPEDEGEIPYEIVDSGDYVYITARMPADPKNLPVADIQATCVHINIDNRNTTIMLGHPIDKIHSHYRVHRGVMDITLKKVQRS
jgi:HSP20 family molecular chaperone IbpA